MATSRACRLSSDCFCYVCGHYISPKQTKHCISSDTKFYLAYKLYFGMAIGDQEKSWAPHFICGSCRSTLEAWLRGTRRCMPFAIPRIWREQSNHHDDCYFCMVNISKFKGSKRRSAISYPSIPSSIAPVPHGDEFPIPVPPTGDEQPSSYTDKSDDSDYDDQSIRGSQPHFPNKQELDNLVRDLGLTKSDAEILTSRLKEWNLLDHSCKSSSYRKRHITFSQYYTVDENSSLCYCTDIKGLFEEIGVAYVLTDWRLFIDSSSKSLKAVLLHNGNMYPSIPVGHSGHMKEDYANVKYLLEKIKYGEHVWDLCGDFKMFCFLLGLQGGYTKHSCFLCLWDSRAHSLHYIQREWPIREFLLVGQHNVTHDALVPRSKILMPPLHIKLGLIKQFTKALDFDHSEAFHHMRIMFPKLSDAKLKGGIFTGPDIRKMLSSSELEAKMSLVEKRAWQAFRCVVEGFLGKNKMPNYKYLVEDLLAKFCALGCRMSIKMHYLHSHLDRFSDNMSDISDEHGERFHQQISKMEKRYVGNWSANMMGDYVWTLVRSGNASYKRKARSSVHF